MLFFLVEPVLVIRDCDCQAATLNSGEFSHCIELVASRRIHDLGDHCRRQAILVQDVFPTTAPRYDAAVSEFEIFRRFQDTYGMEELVSTGLDDIGRTSIQYLRVCSAAGSLAPGEWGTLTSGLPRHVPDVGGRLALLGCDGYCVFAHSVNGVECASEASAVRCAPLLPD